MYLVDDFEKCDCDCHNSGALKKTHITPCCRKCRKCGANIQFGFMESHLEKCLGSNCDELELRRLLEDIEGQQ